MEDFIKAVGAIVVVAATVFLMSGIGGTIVWLFWGDCIPYAFPKIVESGYLARDLTWWQSVTLVWVLGILIRNSSKSSKSKD